MEYDDVSIYDEPFKHIIGSGYSFGINDYASFVRHGSGRLGSDSRTRTFKLIREEVEKRESNKLVIRNTMYILQKFIKYKAQKNKNVVIGSRDIFVETLLYYSRQMLGFPAEKPKKFHKELRKFIKSTFNQQLNKQFVEKRNSTYSSILQRAKIDNEKELTELYRLALIFDNYFLKSISTKSKLPTLVAFILLLKEKGLVNIYQINITKKFHTAPNYAKEILFKKREVFEEILENMDKKDLEEFISIVENIFG